MCRILIVEDDEFSCKYMSDLLRYTKTADTYTAHDGQQALDFLEECHERGIEIDGIILDMFMPRLNGNEFLKQRRKSPWMSEIPVVVITAYDEVKPMEDVAEVIYKPDAEGRLIHAVKEHFFAHAVAR